MRFQRRADKAPKDTNLSYNNTPLELVQSYNYLGLDINSKGEYNNAIETLTNKSRKAIFEMRSLTSSLARFKPHTDLKLLTL